MTKLSDELKHWGYHASLSEEGKKQHLEMSEKAAQLEEENEALRQAMREVGLDDWFVQGEPEFMEKWDALLTGESDGQTNVTV